MSKGIVIKSTGSWYTVLTDNGDRVECRIKGKFRMQGIRTTNPLAVGDHVHFIFDEQTGEGVVESIDERKNYIIRKASNLSKQSQIMAANIDQAVLIATINYPITTTVFIDRFLSSAEAFRIPVTIVFNKLDRYDAQHLKNLESIREIYENIGYQTVVVSAKKGIGIDEFSMLLKDKVSVVTGHSGVGKSTLVNAIEPELNLKTAEISQVHATGKHTTTFAEMHPLSIGGYIIDTPGIRGFGLVEIEKEELHHYFVEIFKESEHCQYNNCTHTHEPGCSVKRAVEEREIAASRYNSYVSIYFGSDEKYR